jgi:hypothetical protein
VNTRSVADELDLGLAEIFQHQDVALSRNFQESQFTQAFSAVLSRSIRTNLSILRGMGFGEVKQTCVRLFAIDALSHVAIAARIGLWGALPESLSVLRGGVESCAQLAFMVSKQLYQTAISEANSKKFTELEFANACRGLGQAGADFAKTHGRISNLASHSTSRRIQFVEYQINGETYDRLGFALDAESAELAIGECVEISQSVASSLRIAYLQDDAPFHWIADLQAIFETHEALRQQLKAKHGGSVANDNKTEAQ